MTKFYKVTLPTGATFTRTTVSRSYSHMVVAVHSVASERRGAEQSTRDYFKRNHKYYEEIVRGGHKEQPIPPSGFHPTRGMTDPANYAAYVARIDANNAQRVIDSTEWLAKGVEGMVAEALAKFDANLATSKYLSADRTERYYDAGWCGRLDLAEKLASTVGRPWIMDTVEITKEEYAALKKAAKAK